MKRFRMGSMSVPTGLSSAGRSVTSELALASIFFLFYFFVGVPVCSGQLSVTDIFDRSNSAVVTVVTPNGFGSGFLISSDGRIVTNYHVIQGARRATVRVLTQHGSDEYRVDGVMTFDAAYDYAVLKVPAYGLPTLKLGDSNTVQIGARVVAIGTPKGFEHTVSDGLVSQVREFGGHTLLQITVPIDRGSSGGPLLNMKGEVIGITSLGIKGELTNFSFALPINYLRGALSSGNTTQTLDQVADWQESRDRKQVAENFVSYEDPDRFFALMYPRGWLVKRCEYTRPESGWVLIKGTIIAPRALSSECQGQASEGIRIRIAHKVPGPGRRFDLDLWIKQILDGDAAEIPGYRVTEPPHAINFAGVGAREMTVNFRDGSDVQQRKEILGWHPSSGLTLDLELASPVSRLTENDTPFKVLLSTFKFTPPER